MRKPGSIEIMTSKLRSIRLKRALTQAEFARKIGLSEPRIRQIERAETAGIFPKVLRALSELTGEPIERLLVDLSATAIPEDPHANLDISSMKPVPEIPTFDLAVAAGPWTEVAQVAELRDVRQINDGRFRIRLQGNSMEPDYPNGSVVEFRALRWGLDDLYVGTDYYVQVDENATFKRLEKATPEACIFRALNRKRYPDPFPVVRADIVRMAKAEWVLKKAGKA